MLITSFIVVTLAIVATALYFCLRLRFFITTTAMLIGSLLFIYGPAYLSYILSNGEYYQHVLGVMPLSSSAFSTVREKVPNIDAVIIAMNFSLALMYASLIAGVEAVNRFARPRAAATEVALAEWNSQALRCDRADDGLLCIIVFSLMFFMLYFSVSEGHLSTIASYFSNTTDNEARNALRLQFAGSPSYLYRLILTSVAPMFVIWGLLSGRASGGRTLLVAAVLLLVVTVVGKIETLSKAPPAFFTVQLMIAALLTVTNRISIKTALLGALAVFLVIYATTTMVMILPSPLHAAYSRVFEAETQALLENFAVFPQIHPHMLGMNIRPIAAIAGMPYIPAYRIVARTWYADSDTTIPSLFIADAWADFGFLGVIVLSAIAGIVSRAIDLIFLSRGKSIVAVVVLAASFVGVVTLLTTALGTALLSGGLLLAPILVFTLKIASLYVSKGLAMARTIAGPRTSS